MIPIDCEYILSSRPTTPEISRSITIGVLMHSRLQPRLIGICSCHGCSIEGRHSGPTLRSSNTNLSCLPRERAKKRFTGESCFDIAGKARHWLIDVMMALVHLAQRLYVGEAARYCKIASLLNLRPTCQKSAKSHE